MREAPLRGVTAIAVVPFAPDESIDLAGYDRILNRLLDGGIRTITCNGNAGEYWSLTTPERRTLAERTVQVVGGAATVLAGVGGSAEDAASDAKFAAEIGAGAIMVHQPVAPFQSADGWVEYHLRVAAAVPELPVVPYLRDPTLPAQSLGELLDRAPNVTAIKYALSDPVKFLGMVTAIGADRITWIDGLAELSAAATRAVGSVGFTSGVANVAPDAVMRLESALAAGQNATGALAAIRPLEALRNERGPGYNVSVLKEALAQLGVIGSTVRPPASRLPDDLRPRVTHALDALGVQPAASRA